MFVHCFSKSERIFCRLDAINSQIRLIQQEKTHAERVAEQLESRARAADLGTAAGNVLYGVDDGQNMGNLSARSTPRNSPQHDFLVTKYNTVFFGVAVCGTHSISVISRVTKRKDHSSTSFI